MNDDLVARLEASVVELHERALELARPGLTENESHGQILQALALHSEALLALAGKVGPSSGDFRLNVGEGKQHP